MQWKINNHKHIDQYPVWIPFIWHWPNRAATTYHYIQWNMPFKTAVTDGSPKLFKTKGSSNETLQLQVFNPPMLQKDSFKPKYCHNISVSLDSMKCRVANSRKQIVLHRHNKMAEIHYSNSTIQYLTLKLLTHAQGKTDLWWGQHKRN